MRTALTAALVVSVFCLYSASAVAQHHTSKQKAEKAKTDAELIASALSAAPPSVSKDATIMAVGPDGKLRTLREGQGAFTCVPDDPSTPGNDPMCLERHATAAAPTLRRGRAHFSRNNTRAAIAATPAPISCAITKPSTWLIAIPAS